MKNMWLWLFIGGLIAFGAFLFSEYPGALDGEFAKADAIYLTLFLIPMISAGVAHYAGRGRAVVRDAAIWIGVIAFLIVAYGYRDIVMQSRLVAELLPSRLQVMADGTLRLKADERGHFFMDAEVNGAKIRFMVDTGATDVVLSQADAERAGLDVDSLSYHRVSSTANGLVNSAPVTLKMLKTGPVVAYDFPASVNGGELDNSLLGMRFLKQFASVKIERHTLILTP